MQKKGNKYGTHRVIEPQGLLTQAAKKIDNTMECWSNEILCDVSALNIDSASFTQICEACGKDLGGTEQMILDIVNERGKMQNPVTGSGGMFIGTVKEIGEDLQGKIDLKVGDKIASLVSLSLTPLKINKIKAIHPEIDRVDVGPGHPVRVRPVRQAARRHERGAGPGRPGRGRRSRPDRQAGRPATPC